MPCSNAIARLLLKEQKAKVKTRTPFTIKLQYEPETAFVQPLTHGLDTGSGVVGSAVVTDQGLVVYQAEVELRNDIAKKMKERSSCRRNRRSRNTRYRPARFDNRANSRRDGRLPPTVTSKVQSHLKEIRFVRSLLPISKTILETASFDPHALKNPEVLLNKSLYQKCVN
jgi:repressor of nif and glnA expression